MKDKNRGQDYKGRGLGLQRSEPLVFLSPSPSRVSVGDRLNLDTDAAFPSRQARFYFVNEPLLGHLRIGYDSQD